MKYIVEQTGYTFKVKDTTTDKYITTDCPKEAAEEIAADFNLMDAGDYSPLLKTEEIPYTEQEKASAMRYVVEQFGDEYATNEVKESAMIMQIFIDGMRCISQLP
jgi:hypothetical protein